MRAPATVTIAMAFHDPITRCNPDGLVQLLKFEASAGTADGIELERWTVRYCDTGEVASLVVDKPEVK